MKKFTIGFIVGFISFLFFCDIVNIIGDNSLEKSFLYRMKMFAFLPSAGLYHPLTGRCVKDIRKLPGNDYEPISVRDYFQCNKAQVIISDIIYRR